MANEERKEYPISDAEKSFRSCTLQELPNEDFFYKVITSDVIDQIIDASPYIKGLKWLWTVKTSVTEGLKMKKLVKYLYGVSNDISDDDRTNFYYELSVANKQESMEQICYLLEKAETLGKVDVIVNLTKAAIRKYITVDDFLRLTVVVSNIPFVDLALLPKFETDNYILGATETLAAAGAISESVIDADEDSKYRLNPLGKYICIYGLDYHVDKPAVKGKEVKNVEPKWNEV